jgi:hypothetical protein
MKKAAPLLLLLAVLVVLALLLLREDDASHPHDAVPAPGAPARAREEATPAPRAPDAGERREVAAADDPVDAPREDAPAAEPQAEARTPIDRTETRSLRVRVVDRFGTPVAAAVVKARGLRTRQRPADAYWWEGPEATTDGDGRAEFERPVWQQSTGSAWHDVAQVRLIVEHPEFVTSDADVDVEQQEALVTLEHGSLVIVSGWIVAPDEVLLDVQPEVSYSAGIVRDDWLPMADGRPSCNKIPEGEHALRISHRREGVTWASRGVDFELVAGEQEELHLQLLPPRRLTGRLGDEVPRPVVDGRLRVGVQHVGAGWQSKLLETHDAEIAPDGSFVVEGLGPGKTEVIALAAGWSSAPVHVDDPEGLALQSVPPDGEEDFVLRMQPTAAVDLTVLGPDGAPVEGARISMWPNVHWATGFSNIFMDDPWGAVTDASGRARVENLPAGDDEGVAVRATGLLMPEHERGGRRQTWVDLAPGGTTELTVRLEAAE